MIDFVVFIIKNQAMATPLLDCWRSKNEESNQFLFWAGCLTNNGQTRNLSWFYHLYLDGLYFIRQSNGPWGIWDGRRCRLYGNGVSQRIGLYLDGGFSKIPDRYGTRIRDQRLLFLFSLYWNGGSMANSISGCVCGITDFHRDHDLQITGADH